MFLGCKMISKLKPAGIVLSFRNISGIAVKPDFKQLKIYTLSVQRLELFIIFRLLIVHFFYIVWFFFWKQPAYPSSYVS